MRCGLKDRPQEQAAGPFLELFARGDRENWDMWGDQATEAYEPDWHTYAYHTTAIRK